MRKDIGTIIVGLLFLGAGIAIGGGMLGYFDFTINFAGWWTLFLIVPALLAIVQGGVNAGNIILLAVGGILLLDAQRMLPPNFSWRLMIPVVLLAVGFQLLFGGRLKHYDWDGMEWKHSRGKAAGSASDGDEGKTDSADAKSSDEAEGSRAKTNSKSHAGRESGGGLFTESSKPNSSYKTASVLFAGQDIRYGDEDFTGAAYSAVFGGLTIDMRRVVLAGDVVINATAIFGGIELMLPDNVRLVTHVTPILGGTECKYPSSRDPNSPRVIVNGTASFGGIEIK